LILGLAILKHGFGSGMKIYTLGSVTAIIRGCRFNGVQRPRIGDGWAIYNFLPERLHSKPTKS